MSDDGTHGEVGPRRLRRENAGRPKGEDTGALAAGSEPSDPGAELLERLITEHELRLADSGSDRGTGDASNPNFITRYWWHTAWITFTVAILVAAFLLATLVG
jgi:hypothetical protein